MHFVVVWITLYETLFVDKQSISRYKHNMKEDVKKYLGLKVRAIREAAGMTQEELAATCDVSWRTISNLERGTVVPDLVMIYKISQEFNFLLQHRGGFPCLSVCIFRESLRGFCRNGRTLFHHV